MHGENGALTWLNTEQRSRRSNALAARGARGYMYENAGSGGGANLWGTWKLRRFLGPDEGRVVDGDAPAPGTALIFQSTDAIENLGR